MFELKGGLKVTSGTVMALTVMFLKLQALQFGPKTEGSRIAGAPKEEPQFKETAIQLL